MTINNIPQRFRVLNAQGHLVAPGVINVLNRKGGGGRSPRLTPVAYKVNLYVNGLSAGDANHQIVTYKTRHYASDKFSKLQLTYANWYPTNGIDTDGPNPITIGMSFMSADGSVIKPFDNATPVTIQPGDEHD